MAGSVSFGATAVVGRAGVSSLDLGERQSSFLPAAPIWICVHLRPQGSEEGSPLFVHLADVRHGWKTADLTIIERQSIVLRYGLDWGYDEIGASHGVRKQSAQQATERAVGKLAAHLNGEPYMDGYDNEDPLEESA
ncbi:hypothetical protein ACIQ7D_10925 [Streptomyces sp. NPDC096310]|uniref:hypothetical protein n=1 Tax=Streptomyces sp. NPDC096310 TaxID=3366082 RepID=UPI00382ED382